MDINIIVTKLVEDINKLKESGVQAVITTDDIMKKLPPDIREEENNNLVETQITRAAIQIINQNLAKNPKYNQSFVHSSEGKLPLLDKLLSQSRLKELSNVKIVKRGSRSGPKFDISGLMGTYYGKKILINLDFTIRRKIVTKDEFDKIKNECGKIKLKLPEIIEPTTTEKFFDAPTPDNT